MTPVSIKALEVMFSFLRDRNCASIRGNHSDTRTEKVRGTLHRGGDGI